MYHLEVDSTSPYTVEQWGGMQQEHPILGRWVTRVTPPCWTPLAVDGLLVLCRPLLADDAGCHGMPTTMDNLAIEQKIALMKFSV